MRRLLYIFFFIPFLGFAGAGQESTHIEALNLLQLLPQTTDLELAVSVRDNKTITEISSSIIKSETWLKTHVLSRYPSTKITTIVIFPPHDSCQTAQHKPTFDLVLTSLKNLHHSLTRWGLEKNIKVSSGFSYQCLNNLETSKHLEMFKPTLDFLRSINSTFTINPPPNFLSLPGNHLDMLHSVEKFGSLSFNKVNFLNPEPEEATATMATRRNLRSLIGFTRKFTLNFPTLPSPSPENSPIHSSIGYPSPQPSPEQSPISSPAEQPPVSSPPEQYPVSSPPEKSPIVSPPEQSPISSPAEKAPISSPPEKSPIPSPGLSLSPCIPHPTSSPPPPPPAKEKGVEGLWCVAKPSVAAETLQQSLDFACGQGGANCDEIKPRGICFYPDTTVAHASYAFNSYWQKTKRNGGSCSFGGTAMLITTDPSYQHCRFVLS
ncbi:Glucan endo-1,3-beta-D-glucosidase [Hirschfeldia incana]|nr:Glucan endo-1,3-beta-D-glucosidase [Hirschfeldia incana]